MSAQAGHDRVYDVVIIGYGPVGATFANFLVRAGLDVAILDRDLDIYDKPRAISLDHEILRIFQWAGLADRIDPIVSTHRGTDFINAEGKVLKHYDPTPGPLPLGWRTGGMFVQPELERELRDGLTGFSNVDILLGHEATGFVEQDDIVETTVRDVTQETEHTLRSNWLVGCDGATSFVRKALALPMDDLAFDEWWMVVDTLLTGEAELPEKSIQYCTPERPATFILGPRNLRRWEIKILPDEDPDIFRNEDRIIEELRRFVDVDAIDLWRAAVYRFHALVLRDWRRGRVLIAGDAAHQMPPFMGQGMCSGLRDATNLAWKLEMIERRGADISLLDTYAEERERHVRELTETTKAFGEIIGELDPDRAAERDRRMIAELEAGISITTRQGHVPGLTCGLIGDGPAAGSLFIQPEVTDADGNTALLDDLTGFGFTLVTPDRAAVTEMSDISRAAWDRLGGTFAVIADAAAAGAPPVWRENDGLFADWCASHGAGGTIVRPDGYAYDVARNTGDLDALIGQLSERVLG